MARRGDPMTLDRNQSTVAAPYLDAFADALTGYAILRVAHRTHFRRDQLCLGHTRHCGVLPAGPRHDAEPVQARARRLLRESRQIAACSEELFNDGTYSIDIFEAGAYREWIA
jgi:hypothetical protein